jgi:hypothetical protein
VADLSAILEKEREKLVAARADAVQRRQAIDDEIAGIDKEIGAIAAYEAAKSGTLVTSPRGVRKAEGGKRRTGVRESLIALIKKHPDGLPRAKILVEMGVGDDKSFEGSVSNALSGLKKAGHIGLKDGIYTAA